MTTTKTKVAWQLRHERNQVELQLIEREEKSNGRIHDLGTDKRYDERVLGKVKLDPREALSLARYLVDYAEAALRK